MADAAGIAGDRLKSLINRIERLEEEIGALNADKSEVYQEAKGTGFDVKVMRQIIQRRRKDRDELDEADTLLDIYERAIGMRPDFGTEVATRARTEDPAVEVESGAEPTLADAPDIEDLDAARDQGREAFASGGRIDRPPQFPHHQLLAAWDRGFTEAANDARKQRLATTAAEGRA